MFHIVIVIVINVMRTICIIVTSSLIAATATTAAGTATSAGVYCIRGVRTTAATSLRRTAHGAFKTLRIILVSTGLHDHTVKRKEKNERI